MATLVAGFGSSHSPMLTARAEDWPEAFLSRDRARQHVDFAGRPCRYDDLLANAPQDAAARIDPRELNQRHANVQAAIARLRDDIAAARLDALIVIGDDQEELFDHSNMPAIGVYYGETIANAKASDDAKDPLDRARMRYREPGGEVAYPCHAPLARHLIDSLQRDNFDLSAMARTAPGKFEGHAVSFVHRFLMGPAPVPVVPIFLNAYYPPNQPTPSRCVALGEAIARAIDSFPAGLRVGVLASGGLSHFVVDEAFDHAVIDAFKHRDMQFFRAAPLHKLMSGSSEIRNWICLAGAVASFDLDWVSYTPGYRTPALTGTGLCFASLRPGGAR